MSRPELKQPKAAFEKVRAILHGEWDPTPTETETPPANRRGRQAREDWRVFRPSRGCGADR
jgi:hypothetical protein